MRLVVLVGLPASGKSTWLHDNQLFALSSDAVREMLTGDVTDQSINRLVFQTLRQLAAARVRAGVDLTYIDSTALTPWERRCWIRFGELHDCRRAYGDRYIRMSGFDSTHGWESIRISFIVNRPKQEPGFRLQRQEVDGRNIRYTTVSYAVDKAEGERYVET